MDTKRAHLSRKYATAYLNVYLDTITLKNFCTIKELYAFLKQEHELLFLFKLPSSDHIKKEVIKKTFDHFSVVDSLFKLTDLLIMHQRLFLLPKVLYYVQELYKERKGINEFHITSYPALDKEQLDGIKKFLSTRTGTHVLYEYTVDNKLIAGIRAQSTQLLWEHSVAAQLRTMKQSLLV